MLLFIYLLMLFTLFKKVKNGNIIHNINYKQLNNINYINNINHINNIIVSVSPGGYKGFYILGIASYIRDHYNIDNCIFSGASAGAWISLLMTYKGDYKLLLDKIGIFTEEFKNQDLHAMENYMKHILLLNCEDISKSSGGIRQKHV